METRNRPGKRFSPILVFLVCAGLLLGSCAKGPSKPEDQNHAPYFDGGIVVSGDKPVIAQGDTDVLLEALAFDIDGDALSFTWSGDGTFFGQDDEQKRVHWRLPESEFGELSVSCRVSDGTAADSLTRSFTVGRGLNFADYGDQVGDDVLWSTNDAPFYILSGNVSIPEGLRLRIEAGVTVWCASGSRLTTQGGLSVEGTRSSWVVMKPYSSGSEGNNWWDGIVFQSSVQPLAVQSLDVRNAHIGLDVTTGAPEGITLQSVSFQDCAKGIHVNNSSVNIVGGGAESCDRGFEFANCSITVANSTFESIIGDGLLIGQGSVGLVSGCIFTGNVATGVNLSGNSFMDFNDNSFLGENIALLVGAYDGGDANEIDATCNFWGHGATGATIPARIATQSGSPTILFEPFKTDPVDDCP